MERSIHIVDWVVFAAVLLISLLVGVYHACTGGKQKTTGEYLMGNRKLPFIPVTLSLLVSFVSTTSTIGFAAEAYTYGAGYSTTIFGYLLGISLAAYVFVPLFYPLRLTSVNEYLLMRYESRLVLVLGSFLTVGAAINYSGTVLYGSSAAIEAMSGFSTRWAIVISGIICTIYTTIGGVKAVIWSDVFQSVVMLAGILYVLIGGIMATASFSRVFEISKEWDRLNIFDFDPDPTKRMNFYGCLFGEAFTCMGVFGYIQSGFQRYAALPTQKQAKWSIFVTIPGHIMVNILCSLSGLVVFAYYTNAGCDPLKAGYIPSPNHILPYFMATAIKMPFLTGLFLASLTAGALSTASSSLNSSGANTWEDVFKHKYPDMKQERQTLWLKILVAVYGAVAILVALAITFSGGILNQIIGTVSSCLQGPAAALFFMGAFVPWVNSKGASVGAISGFFFGLWLVIGSFYSKAPWQRLPTTTANCSEEVFHNISTTAFTTMYDRPTYDTTIYMDDLTTAFPESVPMSIFSRLYNVSFLWKREVVTAFTMGVAMIVSLITGLRKPKSIPPQLVHPLIRRFVGRDITNDANEFKDLSTSKALPEDQPQEFGQKEKSYDVSAT